MMITVSGRITNLNNVNFFLLTIPYFKLAVIAFYVFCDSNFFHLQQIKLFLII